MEYYKIDFTMLLNFSDQKFSLKNNDLMSTFEDL